MAENEIIDYVMNTPGNTNPAVLKTLLDRFANTESDAIFVNVEEDFASEEDRVAFFDAIDSGKIPVGSLNGWICYEYRKLMQQFSFNFYGIDTVPVYNEQIGTYQDKRCFCSRTATCSINSGTRWYLTNPSAIFPLPDLPLPPENI